MTAAAALRWPTAPAFGRVAGILVALLLWELAARALAGSFLLAGPVEVAAWLGANARLVARALGVTAQAAALGFLLGNLIAVALALGCILAPRAERLVALIALIVFCLPLVATGPILRVLWGPGLGPQVTLAALAVFYTTFLQLMVGLRAAPSSWFDLVRSYGRGRWTELREVRAPSALPYLIAGLQIAAPAALLGAMVGEFTGAERGLGVLAIQAMRALDVTATWGIASLAAAAAMLAYGALGQIGRRFGAAPPPVILAPLPDRAPMARMGPLALTLLTLLIALGLWHGLMELFALNPFFAKRPADVAAFLFTDPDAAQHRATLTGALGQTLAFTLPGYLAGLALGAGLAALLTLAPGLATAVLPAAIALRSIPILITAPLIVLALGRGAAGTITIVAVMIFFPTLVACLQGMRQTPGQVIDLFDSYAAPRWQRLILAQVPAMLPAFFGSARMAVPAAVLAATTAEWLATGTGLGSLMALTASTSAYGMLWSAVALIATLSTLAYLAVAVVERAILRRYAPEQLRTL